jgi:hypothetical protein
VNPDLIHVCMTEDCSFPWRESPGNCTSCGKPLAPHVPAPAGRDGLIEKVITDLNERADELWKGDSAACCRSQGIREAVQRLEAARSEPTPSEERCPNCDKTQRWPRPRILNDTATDYHYCAHPFHRRRPSEEPKRCPTCGKTREQQKYHGVGLTCPDPFHSPPEEPGEPTPEQGERRWRIYKDGDRTEIHGPDAHGGIEVIPAPDPQSAPIGVSAPSPDPYEGLCPHRRDPAECPDCSGERVNVSLTREEAKFALSYFWGDNAMAARLQAALRAALDSEAPAGGSE